MPILWENRLTALNEQLSEARAMPFPDAAEARQAAMTAYQWLPKCSPHHE
jgi:hypothetical protein